MATTINTNNKPTNHDWSGFANHTQAIEFISNIEFNAKRTIPEIFQSLVHATLDMNIDLKATLEGISNKELDKLQYIVMDYS